MRKKTVRSLVKFSECALAYLEKEFDLTLLDDLDWPTFSLALTACQLPPSMREAFIKDATFT